MKLILLMLLFIGFFIAVFVMYANEGTLSLNYKKIRTRLLIALVVMLILLILIITI